MRKTVVGVMGGCTVDPATLEHAREAGGLTVGVLFDDDQAAASEHLDIVIPTGMGAGRNIITCWAATRSSPAAATAAP